MTSSLSETGTEPPKDTPRAADVDRTAALARVLTERTREARARIERRGDYDAVVVRGEKVPHGLYVRVAIVLAVAAFLGALALGMSAANALLTAAVVAGLWCLVWLFLALTGGEETDLIEAHEDGRVTIARSGRLVETRPIALRIVIPVLVLAVCGYLVVTLGASIVHPPAVVCNAPPSLVSAQPDACMAIADPGGNGQIGAVFTADQVKTMDLAFRTLWFVGVCVVIFFTGLFLWAMFTGHHFLNVSPIKWPRSTARRGRLVRRG